MDKKITITVPEEFVSELEELAREKGLSEEEIILNALRRRVAGSRIHSLADLKAAAAKSRKAGAKESRA